MMQLRDWRKKRGLTQQALAEALGLTNSAITKYEKGSQRPRPELANRIEAFTRGEVTAASLLGVSATRPGKRSVREDAQAFTAGDQITISLIVSADQVRLLESAGVDVNAVARSGAERAIKEAEGRAWAETNRDAIEAYNVWIEKHGTLAEQFGLI